MDKKLLIFLLAVIVVGVGAFYGGMKYTENKSLQSRFSQADFQNLRNLSLEEKQQRLQQFGISGTGFNGGQRGVGGFVNGEIILKDDKSITIKLRDGGSKIVFYSDATKIEKFLNGVIADLETGKLAIVSGKVNSDGSIIAETIQLHPQQ
jgi:hypothetical protein